jgi:predicted RNase H-like nuclease (RuvC/YqgF family)
MEGRREERFPRILGGASPASRGPKGSRSGDEPWAVVGIDPGLDGGVALIGADGSVLLRTTPVLTAGSRREYDVAAMAGLLSARPIGLAVIEAAGARPGQGS